MYHDNPIIIITVKSMRYENKTPIRVNCHSIMADDMFPASHQGSN
jgi:hypothetical protein